MRRAYEPPSPAGPVLSSERTSSLHRGLADGARYASTRSGERPALIRLARARSAAEVHSALAGTAEAPEDIVDPVAYWSGFAHGVASQLLEAGVALLDHSSSA